MSCSRNSRRRRFDEDVESVREDRAESESFRNSKCFLVIWRDRFGRRRCKCCRRCRD